jgi:hypothetical protein
MRTQGTTGAWCLRVAAGGVVLAVGVLTAAPAMADIIGSADGDSIRGGPGPNWIEGRAGNDRIWGEGGSDFIHGNSGNDRLSGGPVLDFLNGWGGNDRLYFGSGSDYGLGMGGNDLLRGGTGSDRPLQGGPGRDRIWGGSGDDRLLGQQDRDLIRPGDGADESDGGGDRDQFLLRDDGAPDQVKCGTQSDLVMYEGQQDEADTLTGCERIWTDVTTARCVTAVEWQRASVGMRMARVHRIFETDGELVSRRTPQDFGRMYLQCQPDPFFSKCFADVDFRVDSAGVARLTEKFWSSMCWT